MDPSDSPPIYLLPSDTLHMIFLHLPLRQILICRCVSKAFLSLLSSPAFLSLLSSHLPPLTLLSLRPHHHHHHHRRTHHHPSPPLLLSFDPSSSTWLRFSLSYLPFPSPSPITSSSGLIYLWSSPTPLNTLIITNPLTRSHRTLPPLGSAWSKHGSVLAGPPNRVLVLTELATLSYHPVSNSWLKFSSNLPSKPRSPVLISNSILALCDVGSPWRSLWKMFKCELPSGEKASLAWTRVERPEWGDVFDILKRPRLVKGVGERVYMIGGLKSSFSLNAGCSTILILRLDLKSMVWDEAGKMPVEMYKCFQESSKFKVFGGGETVCFSAKRVGKLAMWDCGSGVVGGEWRWIEGASGFGDGVFRGFVFDARLDASP